MMMCEFIDHVNEYRIRQDPANHELMQDFPQEDYAIVEYVYTWHPSIPAVGGKKTIAALYELGGMCLIRDMVATARIQEEKEEKIQRIRGEIIGKIKELEEVTKEKYALTNL